jgi:hypothetical protein
MNGDTKGICEERDMLNKKLMVCVFVFILGVSAFLLMPMISKNPLLAEIKTVKEMTTYVDIASSNGLYSNYHKKFDSSFVKTILESIKLKKTKCGGESRKGQWAIYFDFYNNDSRILRIILNAETGKLKVVGKGDWSSYLTSESQLKLIELLAQVGLTADLGPLPLADNVPATTNAVFRKESSVPYAINNSVFIMPREHFSVGVVANSDGGVIYRPGDYDIYYRDDQKYDNALGINYHVNESSSGEKQALLDIRNDCSFDVRFSLYYVVKDELDYMVGGYEIEKGRTLSLKADPNVDCYILGIIRKISDEIAFQH